MEKEVVYSNVHEYEETRITKWHMNMKPPKETNKASVRDP